MQYNCLIFSNLVRYPKKFLQFANNIFLNLLTILDFLTKFVIQNNQQ